jgi:uncharacterized protein YjbJ (UPF0337 family)
METTHKNETPFSITGDWSKQTKHLKEKFPQLTDADLHLETGKEQEMLGRLSSRLNKKQEEVIGIIKAIQPERLNTPPGIN